MMRDNVGLINAARKEAFASQQRQAPVDYKLAKKTQSLKGLPLRFLFECALKLEMKPLTSATAAVLFHRFFREISDIEYDPYMIACSCLYLAGKIKEDKVRKRDIINVAHNTINREAPPLDPCDEYWAMWDSIVQAELFIARMLKFDMTIVHPHKYMLHYMKSLQDLFGAKEWHSMPVARAAASFLQDFHHSAKILDYKPSHTAVCCLALAFQVHGIQVPLTDEADETVQWYTIFCDDLTREKHWEILESIMEVYSTESTGEGK